MHIRDWVGGKDILLGSHTVSRDEIIAFAKAYDPQRFHVDDAAAKDTHFGALCASGWHTASLWMKAFVTWAQTHGEPGAVDCGISPGFRNLKWLRPVYVGDTLAFYTKITAHRPAEKQPGYLLVKDINWADNQDGVRVFEFTGSAFIPDPGGDA